MTNREYLQSLTIEELVQTVYFDCPYSFIEREDINFCKKKAIEGKLNNRQFVEFVFGGEQREICNQCKVKWLSAKRKFAELKGGNGCR